jgi:transcriptional regulator with XRE-family HTH domain
MTPEEKRAAKQTAKILSSVRKSRGMTQIEVAKGLGISQSALSKLERGYLIPSVFQWFEFCKITAIPADSHVLGYVDFATEVPVDHDLSIGGFKFAKKYLHGRRSTVRTALPFVKWLEQSVGAIRAESVIKDMGADPDYFVQLDLTVSLQFILDLAQYLKDKGHLSSSQHDQMIKEVAQGHSHGHLWQAYQKEMDPLQGFELLLSKAGYYERNFDYQITEKSEKKKLLQFRATPSQSLLDSKGVMDHECKDVICTHRTKYFTTMARIHADRGTIVRELECSFSGSANCVFEVQF